MQRDVCRQPDLLHDVPDVTRLMPSKSATDWRQDKRFVVMFCRVLHKPPYARLDFGERQRMQFCVLGGDGIALALPALALTVFSALGFDRI